jgi:hypothetical protein
MRHLTVKILAVTAGLTLASAGFAQPDRDIAPNGKGIGTISHPGPQSDAPGADRSNAGGNGNAGSSNNGIFYHGGPVMTGTKNVYLIWYGNWAGNTATTIIPSLIGGLNGSAYFNINTTYTDGSGARVANSIALKGQTNDNYSQGKSLTDAGVQAVVSNAIAHVFGTDSNGVYFVLTSSDVNETTGFCTQYCGWHTAATISGTTTKYAFVGNPDRCPSACEQQTTSPNGNAGADGMASIISHELEEASTDPNLNAWYDRRGQENADKCAWTFGATSTASNGSLYNMTLGGKQYLIQRNWVNASGGYCALNY